MKRFFKRLFCCHYWVPTYGCTVKAFDPWMHRTWKCRDCGKEKVAHRTWEPFNMEAR